MVTHPAALRPAILAALRARRRPVPVAVLVRVLCAFDAGAVRRMLAAMVADGSLRTEVIERTRDRDGIAVVTRVETVAVAA